MRRFLARIGLREGEVESALGTDKITLSSPFGTADWRVYFRGETPSKKTAKTFAMWLRGHRRLSVQATGWKLPSLKEALPLNVESSAWECSDGKVHLEFQGSSVKVVALPPLYKTLKISRGLKRAKGLALLLKEKLQQAPWDFEKMLAFRVDTSDPFLTAKSELYFSSNENLAHLVHRLMNSESAEQEQLVMSSLLQALRVPQRQRKRVRTLQIDVIDGFTHERSMLTRVTISSLPGTGVPDTSVLNCKSSRPTTPRVGRWRSRSSRCRVGLRLSGRVDYLNERSKALFFVSVSCFHEPV
ncbi:MAG: hypothetical protein MHM6MM_003859 [Cercozoa sp. M6MM]